MIRTWGDFWFGLGVALTLSFITVGGAYILRITNPALLTQIVHFIYGTPR